MKSKIISSIMIIALSINVLGQESVLKLPEPNRTGGMPVMEALQSRTSHRKFLPHAISLQQLSDLCWAAWGINRSETGKRTAPSSHNYQEMELYVVLPEAVYLYDAIDNQLNMVRFGDHRKLCGTQDYVAEAPVNFMYVADLQKRGIKNAEEITEASLLSSWANTGFMAQNVYLVCASNGLGTVIRAMIDRDKMHSELGLRPMQRIILGQTIGMIDE